MRSIAIIAAAAAALLATQAGAATTANNAGLDIRNVSFKNVDFNNPQAVSSFYTKLNSAAREVCTSYGNDARSNARDRACVQQIMNQAVSGMQRPMLTARHDAARSNTAYATGF